MTKVLKALTRAARPPRPETVCPAQPPDEGEARASLAAGHDAVACVTRLRAMAEPVRPQRTLAVPSPDCGPRLAFELCRWLSDSTRVTLGLSHVHDRRARERWSALASRLGLDVRPIGTSRWGRVELGAASDTLGYVDLPAELAEYDQTVVLDRARPPVMTFWRGVAHPHSALRAWAAGAQGLADLALATEARYLLQLELAGVVVALDCRDRVAAQVIASAWKRVDEELLGIEAPGPWEDVDTQSLVAVAGGITLPSQLVIAASVGDTGIEYRLERLGELLGCRVEWKAT